jgi:transglutaminase-like putative cysteine protease
MDHMVTDMNPWLAPTQIMDFQSSDVQEFIEQSISSSDTLEEKVIKLYYAVRDKIFYNPYAFSFDPAIFKASTTVTNGKAFCVPKAILYCAVARAIGVPSRLGFADVRNHLSTQKLRELLKSDIYRMHGYTSLYLNERWVKATPVFNIELCDRFGVKPLEFNGKEDSLLHDYNKAGDRHMEYLKDYGTFDDMPVALLFEVYQTYYPHLFTQPALKGLASHDFMKEASEETSE